MPQEHPASKRHVLVFGRGKLDASAAAALCDNGWVLLCAETLEEATELCDKFDVLTGLALCPHPLTDEELCRISGGVNRLRRLQWLALLTREDLARADVRWLIIGALRDYQLYPVDVTRLTIALGHAWGIAALAEAERRANCHDRNGRFGLVGTSPPMMRLYDQIERVAEADLPVLVTGETGTGKELVVRAIHAQSPRATEPFVALNCAAIPESLIQAELFGVTKGAFTDATVDNEGMIRAADGGTLLLDEVGELPLQSQASLLRFLEERTVTPVGGRNSVSVDITIIASTNRDLSEEVQRGRFRRDLLYRLDVLAVETPPLRDRVADIEALAEHFLCTAFRDNVMQRRPHGLTDDALDWLRVQAWPGNVRELRSCIIQAALKCRGHQITANDLIRLRPAPSAPSESLSELVQSTEKGTLERLLAQNGGNASQTARDLQVSRTTLYRLMAKHGIARS
jgi:DNA-binding NtrC family response regulator